MPSTGYDNDAASIGWRSPRPSYRRRLLLVFAFVAAVVLGAALGTLARVASPITGTVRNVDDGDSFRVCRGDACVRVRLCGVDAPERGQPGYDAAKQALHRLLVGQRIVCRIVGDGTPCDGRSQARNRDRIVAQCFTSTGADVAAEMVRRRLACDWEAFSGGHYARTTGGPICAR